MRTPICFSFGLAVASLLFFTNRAGSDQLLTEQTSACNRVDACLLVLDSWSKSYNGRIEVVSDAVLYVLDDLAPCAQEQWQSIDFGLPDRRRRQDPYTVTARLKRPPGLLTGVNHGEFGGSLVWIPDGGRSAVLFKDFGIMGIEPDDDGAVFITGLNHMGFNFGVVGLLARTGHGQWTLRELAHLPGEGTESWQSYLAIIYCFYWNFL